jgi:hypothetical protein
MSLFRQAPWLVEQSLLVYSEGLVEQYYPVCLGSLVLRANPQVCKQFRLDNLREKPSLQFSLSSLAQNCRSPGFAGQLTCKADSG